MGVVVDKPAVGFRRLIVDPSGARRVVLHSLGVRFSCERRQRTKKTMQADESMMTALACVLESDAESPTVDQTATDTESPTEPTATKLDWGSV